MPKLTVKKGESFRVTVPVENLSAKAWGYYVDIRMGSGGPGQIPASLGIPVPVGLVWTTAGDAAQTDVALLQPGQKGYFDAVLTVPLSGVGAKLYNIKAEVFAVHPDGTMYKSMGNWGEQNAVEVIEAPSLEPEVRVYEFEYLIV